MFLPIVIIHRYHPSYDSEYLLYTLAQAKRSNTESNVILLGDYSNSYYQFIDFENILNYSQEATEFQKIYKHHSINDYKYELFCFQRWLILKEFMKTKNIQKCLSIDSDVMLYANVTEEQNKFASFDLTLSYSLSPHCVYVNNLNILEKFSNFLFKIYANDLLFKIKVRELQYQDWLRQKLPNLSDMTVFEELKKNQEITIGEISNIISDTKYDHNINLSEGFEMCDGRKNIYFIQEKPFGKHLASGREIQFNALHFQGYQNKKYMKDYFMGAAIFKEIRQWEIKSYATNYYTAKSLLETTSYSSLIKSSRSLNETCVTLPFNLRDINLIVFPDWKQSEESLHSDLERVVKAIATHPDRSQMTLLINIDNISDEDANLILSDVVMNMLMQSDLDCTETEVSLVGNLNEIQWQALLTFMHACLMLENENKLAIAKVRADNIQSCDLRSLSDKRAVQSEAGAWELR